MHQELLQRIVAPAVMVAAVALPAVAQSGTEPHPLISFDFNPKSIDVIGHPASVECTLHATDVAFISVAFQSDRRQFRSCYTDSPQSGDVHDGIWACDVAFEPFDEEGTWTAWVYAFDLLHNSWNLAPAELEAMGFPARLEVVGLTLFEPPVAYIVGDKLGPLAIGDFYEDGHQDIVTVHNGLAPDYLGSVEVLLGNGDGTFAPATLVSHLPPGRQISAKVGDFDQDGHQDLATVSQSARDAVVLLGNGDGTFADAVAYFAGDGPMSLDVGDVNLDGIADIVTANYDYYEPFSSPLTVLLGYGDGTFADAESYGSGDTFCIAIGEFNHDGKPDLAQENRVWLGQGDGSFFAGTNLPSVGGYSIAVGDFDEDGHQDIVKTMASIPPYTSSSVVVHLGSGDGTFPSGTGYDAPGRFPMSVAVSDFDQDGHQDLVFGDADFNCLTVLLGRGDGTFASGESLTYPVAWGITLVAVGDFDRNGWPDLVTRIQGTDVLFVLLNSGGPQSIEVDIKPDNETNPINPRTRGVTPVALLGSEEFDVTEVDVTTLRLGPSEAAPAHDLTDDWPFSDPLRDVNGDGFTDLLVHFSTQESGIQCGDTEVTLTGQLLDGFPIEGTDSIRTVGCSHRAQSQSGRE